MSETFGKTGNSKRDSNGKPDIIGILNRVGFGRGNGKNFDNGDETILQKTPGKSEREVPDGEQQEEEKGPEQQEGENEEEESSDEDQNDVPEEGEGEKISDNLPEDIQDKGKEQLAGIPDQVQEGEHHDKVDHNGDQQDPANDQKAVPVNNADAADFEEEKSLEGVTQGSIFAPLIIAEGSDANSAPASQEDINQLKDNTETTQPALNGIDNGATGSKAGSVIGAGAVAGIVSGVLLLVLLIAVIVRKRRRSSRVQAAKDISKMEQGETTIAYSIPFSPNNSVNRPLKSILKNPATQSKSILLPLAFTEEESSFRLSAFTTFSEAPFFLNPAPQRNPNVLSIPANSVRNNCDTITSSDEFKW